MLRINHVHPLPLLKSLPRQPAFQRRPIDSPDAASAPRRVYLGPLLISAFLCLSGVGVYMWPRVQGVRLAYRLQGAEQRLKDLIQEGEHLRLELATLKDPQRVHQVATEQLGMVAPRADQVFVLVRESRKR
jgi:cell division protein FtsL